jgi:hypothetical protein
VKVLFTCVVGVGHFHPMVPLARALQAGGHEVEFATDPDLSRQVGSLGFKAHPAGLNHPDALSRYLQTNPGLGAVPAAERIRYWFGGMFARIRVPPMLDDLARILQEGKPDLLIHGSMEMAGGIAAEVAGIPHVEHSVGVMRPNELVSLALEDLAPIARAAGVAGPYIGGSGGELYLALCPPTLEDPGIAAVSNAQRLRPIGFDESPGVGLPAWIGDLAGRPTVYVTLGTIFNEALGIFRAILEGLSEADLNVVVTIGRDGDPAALGTLPSSVPGGALHPAIIAAATLRPCDQPRRLRDHARRRERRPAPARGPAGGIPVHQLGRHRAGWDRPCARAPRLHGGGGAQVHR